MSWRRMLSTQFFLTNWQLSLYPHKKRVKTIHPSLYVSIIMTCWPLIVNILFLFSFERMCIGSRLLYQTADCMLWAPHWVVLGLTGVMLICAWWWLAETWINAQKQLLSSASFSESSITAVGLSLYLIGIIAVLWIAVTFPVVTDPLQLRTYLVQP